MKVERYNGEANGSRHKK